MAKVLENTNHDLIQQLSEKLDSHWRYEEYIKNAQDHCESCAKIWQNFMQKEEAMINELRQEIERHVQEGTFN
jgi:hypothetical protein